MIKHVVMFRLRDDIDKPHHLRELQRRLEGLPDRIEVLRRLEVGLNLTPSPRAGDLLLWTEFTTWEDLEIYRDHPDHQEVVEYIRTIVSESRVVDYESSSS